ncbi:MAG: hypothetical protein KJO54_05045 [Gammaproteobacteria bacterium]|nr:hypothetical protein [Gammaproteobacteria bacterium]NNF60375.1 hypothetical protein [Gammaproteobacteria bacterium]
MNWKIVLLGGLAMYVAQFVVAMAFTGPVIHEGVLEAPYDETTEFWRPELTSEPPDMAALMPMWIASGIIGALVIAGLYSWLRPAFSGSWWQKGIGFGVALTLFVAVYHLSLSGVFNLPGEIWFWWTVDMLIMAVVGSVALAFVAQKVAPES